MALQEKLDRFKKQQQACQSTLIGIASTRKPAGPAAASSSSNGRTQASATKFSNDTERLQHINSIRKGPIGAQMKRVIDLLRQTRQALTPEQINEACYVDMRTNKDVFESLKKNPKVHFDGDRFSYKFPEGIPVIDMKDAYPTVMEDLQALKAAGQIWLLSNFDSQEDIAYPNDPRVPIKVDGDLKQLFRGIELPKDMHVVERDLQKNGMKPATDTEKRRSAAQVQGISTKPKPKKKKKEITNRTKLTNSHLPELFKNLS